jgi:hypothetical protein
MEEVTEAVNNLTIAEGAAGAAPAAEGHKKNRIQVSNTKKPLFFYVNLAKVGKGNPICSPCGREGQRSVRLVGDFLRV